MFDYSGMYDSVKEEENVEAEIVEKEETEEIDEVEDDLVFGRVKADRLYLREKASKDSKDLKILDKDEEVMIDEPVDPSSDWIHVCSQEGLEGYVMKEFVTI